MKKPNKSTIYECKISPEIKLYMFTNDSGGKTTFLVLTECTQSIKLIVISLAQTPINTVQVDRPTKKSNGARARDNLGKYKKSKDNS